MSVKLNVRGWVKMVKSILLSMLVVAINVTNLYSCDVKAEIETAFYSLVVDVETKNEFIPSQTKVLSVQWDGKTLVVDVSKEIGDYGGGTAIEHEIMCQLLNTAFSIQEVEVFTLLIEGEEKYLPEGTEILNYTRQRYLNNVARY